MSDALKFGGFIGGSILGTVGLNAGATALLRNGLGHTLSYTPTMVAGGTASVALLASLLIHEKIKEHFSNNSGEKADLVMLGFSVLSGGVAAKLLFKEVAKTQACALSVLSFLTSNLMMSTVGSLINGEDPIEGIMELFNDYIKASMWAMGLR